MNHSPFHSEVILFLGKTCLSALSAKTKFAKSFADDFYSPQSTVSPLPRCVIKSIRAQRELYHVSRAYHVARYFYGWRNRGFFFNIHQFTFRKRNNYF